MDAEKKQKALLERAREAVAARHEQPYHKRAILAGDWDTGFLVRDALAEIRKEEGHPVDGN